MSDMKSVRSVIVPSLHIGILPQELNLEKIEMFISVRFANVGISLLGYKRITDLVGGVPRVPQCLC